MTRTDTEKAHHTPRVLLPDWRKVALKGREVRIVYDSDIVTERGGRAERDLACLLRAEGATVRVVRLPMLDGAQKQGVDDFLARGGTLADLEPLLDEAAPSAEEVLVIQADTLSAEEIVYLWEPYIPRQMVTILDGDPGVEMALPA